MAAVPVGNVSVETLAGDDHEVAEAKPQQRGQRTGAALSEDPERESDRAEHRDRKNHPRKHGRPSAG